ncbi:hypothetical protein A5719_21785 [Mycolicibacterium peregrinum]|uniref:MaoC/PaaZ C-terminal domain-containing protein n=1 Tax=Mycolicibacterium peregrinum TaxID=43304 RepID=UPI0007EBBA35|nr:MaoC/PaaZ C-terminal domain-containing protein [Mycolicibacterium peregrinum]OBF37448.1 hypothetical protein A5719_21785 [Mycolicibacterium peregrinum]
MTVDMRTVAVGTELPPQTVFGVRDEDIRIVALILRDPNPIHFDLNEVARLGLGDRAVNQGGATMAYVASYLTELAGSRAAISKLSCSFRGNVFAGDDVAVGATVTAVTDTDGGRLVECDVWADVVGGKRAITGTAVVRV